eukprot:1160079-Prorocentrum_lima.AAC.1
MGGARSHRTSAKRHGCATSYANRHARLQGRCTSPQVPEGQCGLTACISLSTRSTRRNRTTRSVLGLVGAA